MKNYSSRYSKYALGLFVFILTLSLVHWIGNSGFLRPGVVGAKITQQTIVFDKANPQVQAVMAVQNRHTPDLMALPEVVGTATGLTEAGRPAILVFAKNAVEPGVIPRSLEGTPVVVKVTGEIFAMPRKPKPDKPAKDRVDPTARFDRPVPIGVSTGNEDECSAGTIGARVKDDSGNVYALSNNHVYALENKASSDSRVLQPGLYDTNCVFSPENVIGTLSDFVSIDFNGDDNTVDAAIAISSTDNLDNATPSNGYGIPKSATVTASIDQAVQKYGRTTSLTKGTITAIGATMRVTYGFGTAIFVNQIVVESRKPFIKPGDSGSLLVTYRERNPVGLLFAGNPTGKLALANPIDAVLGNFGVTIDGE
ncbi:MAG: hypothetical protein KAU38_02030 [Desulfobacterales bacterium]|nr:hypothetical protein [Desulfobacterales bacterium]